MVGAEKMGTPDCGDYDVRRAGDGGQVFRARVGDGHGGIAARAALHEKERHGFSDNHAPAHDDRVFASGFDAGFLKEADAAERSAGNKSSGILERELGDIHGVETINIFAWIDGADDRGFVDLWRGRGLDEDSVDGGVGVEFFDEGEKLLLCCVGREFFLHRVEAEFGGFAVLRAHIRAGGGIIAHEHHGEAGLDAALAQGVHALFGFHEHLGGYRRSVNPHHFLEVPPVDFLQPRIRRRRGSPEFPAAPRL